MRRPRASLPRASSLNLPVLVGWSLTRRSPGLTPFFNAALVSVSFLIWVPEGFSAGFSSSSAGLAGASSTCSAGASASTGSAASASTGASASGSSSTTTGAFFLRTLRTAAAGFALAGSLTGSSAAASTGNSSGASIGVSTGSSAISSSGGAALGAAFFLTALITLMARLGAGSAFGKYLARTLSASSAVTELDGTLTSAPSRRRSSITRFVSCLTSRARS